MSEMVLASTADGSNPRLWSAVCPVKTRPLGRESAAWFGPLPSSALLVSSRPSNCLHPRMTSAAYPRWLELSGPIPRIGVVRGFRPRNGPSQLISWERFRGLVQSDLVVCGLVHHHAFAIFLHACP
ncbi:hypothetical protein Bca52824_064423 [Brassica carinata]|uniref:Uncharacterized protein n=1 Tax=Brassica carinata TaxID=52824 RepID=A0A8X7QL31_BRACI|nr:hypothetical protein Bca52824_064423 [Brassica carinata]